MLVVDDCRFQVGDLTILDGCSLSIDQGTICSMLGPSGSGKTTMLRAIMGLVVPQAGRLSFADQVLSDGGSVVIPPEKRPFSFLFQNFTLFPHLNVRRNITIGVRHLPRAERKERLDRFAHLLKIDHLVDRQIHDLSGGEQQRVALARTLALSPKVLLLDEPFSNLDKMTKYELYHDIKSLIREQGMSAVLATHDQEEAFFFSDRMVVMNKGQIVADDAPQVIYSQPQTEWIARFTGDAHIFSADDMQAIFADFTPQDHGGRYVVRPEQVEIAPVKESSVIVEDVSFYGPLSHVALLANGTHSLSALVTGLCSFSPGQQVSLSLRTAAVRLPE